MICLELESFEEITTIKRVCQLETIEVEEKLSTPQDCATAVPNATQTFVNRNNPFLTVYNDSPFNSPCTPNMIRNIERECTFFNRTRGYQSTFARSVCYGQKEPDLSENSIQISGVPYDQAPASVPVEEPIAYVEESQETSKQVSMDKGHKYTTTIEQVRKDIGPDNSFSNLSINHGLDNQWFPKTAELSPTSSKLLKTTVSQSTPTASFHTKLQETPPKNLTFDVEPARSVLSVAYSTVTVDRETLADPSRIDSASYSSTPKRSLIYSSTTSNSNTHDSPEISGGLSRHSDAAKDYDLKEDSNASLSLVAKSQSSKVSSLSASPANKNSTFCVSKGNTTVKGALNETLTINRGTVADPSLVAFSPIPNRNSSFIKIRDSISQSDSLVSGRVSNADIVEPEEKHYSGSRSLNDHSSALKNLPSNGPSVLHSDNVSVGSYEDSVEENSDSHLSDNHYSGVLHSTAFGVDHSDKISICSYDDHVESAEEHSDSHLSDDHSSDSGNPHSTSPSVHYSGDVSVCSYVESEKQHDTNSGSPKGRSSGLENDHTIVSNAQRSNRDYSNDYNVEPVEEPYSSADPDYENAHATEPNVDSSNHVLGGEHEDERVTKKPEPSKENLVSTSRIIRPNNPSSLRRSHRNRTQPIESWRGEKAVYKSEKTDSGYVFSLVAIEKAPQPTIRFRKRVLRPKQNPQIVAPPPVVSWREMLNMSLHGNKKAVVLNSNELQDDCQQVFEYNKYNWKPSDSSKNVDTAIVERIKKSTFGLLRFGARAEKSRSKSGNYTTFFLVVHGVFVFNVNDKDFLVRTGSSFKVDPQTCYSITNCRNDDGIINFTASKG